MMLAAAAATLILAAVGLPVFSWLRLEVGGFAWIFWPVWLLPFLSLPLSYSARREAVRRWMHRLGECCIGAALYLALAFILKALALIILGAASAEVTDGVRVWAGRAAFVLFAAVYLAGVVTALRIKTVRLTVPAPLDAPLRLVLISDLHLGWFTGRRMTERIAAAVNREAPDAVLIAGDIFDMDYDSLRDPERHSRAMRSMTPPLGIYACLGNHDMLCVDSRKDEWIAKSGVTVLSDEAVPLGGATLLGRRDVRDSHRLPASEVYADLRGGYVITLDHNPGEYRGEWDSGASLLLCGHTHGGQTFPLNILQRLVMPMPIYGLRREGEKRLYVTSGAGFWGPPLRLGVRNEIVRIDLVPERGAG